MDSHISMGPNVMLIVVVTQLFDNTKKRTLESRDLQTISSKKCYYPSHNYYTHFICLERYLHSKAHDVAHNLHHTQTFSGTVSYMIALGSKVHETFESWKDTHLGVTRRN